MVVSVLNGLVFWEEVPVVEGKAITLVHVDDWIIEQ